VEGGPKVLEALEKLVAEHAERSKVFDVARGKPEMLDIVEEWIESRRDRESCVGRE
jgi:hypothetical protein